MRRGNLPRSAVGAVMRWIPTAARGLTTPVAAPFGIKRSRLFRKYVALFAAVVCVALLTNGLFEIWFYYREHKAALIRIQREQAEAAADKIGRFIKEIESQLGWTTQMAQAASTPEQLQFTLRVCSAKYPPSPSSRNSTPAAASSCVFRGPQWMRLAAIPTFPTIPAS